LYAAGACGGEGRGGNVWGRETKKPTTIGEVKGVEDSMKRIMWRRIVWAVAFGARLCPGLAAWRIGRVLWRSTGQFVVHADDARVMYEPGAEMMAGQVAAAL